MKSYKKVREDFRFQEWSGPTDQTSNQISTFPRSHLQRWNLVFLGHSLLEQIYLITMGSVQGPVFAAAPEMISTHALLFDFDGEFETDILRMRIDADKFQTGTIIDSTQAIVKHWHQ